MAEDGGRENLFRHEQQVHDSRCCAFHCCPRGGRRTLRTQEDDSRNFPGVWLTFWSIGVAALLVGVSRGWKSVFAEGRSRGGSLVGAIVITVFAIPFFLGELFGISMLAVTTSVFIAAVL